MIKVKILAESRYPVARKRLKKAIIDFLKKGGVTEASEIEVEVAIVGTRKMQKLNKDFLGVDEVTDVLSFPEEGEPGEKFVQKKQKFLSLGSVVVCYPRAQEQANQRNVLVDDEVEELVIHGLKHLLGINHN